MIGNNNFNNSPSPPPLANLFENIGGGFNPPPNNNNNPSSGGLDPSTSEMCARLTYIGKICTIFHTRHTQVVKHNHYLFFGLCFFNMV